MDGIVIRVYTADGSVTPAFEELNRLACALSDYPCLDENDYSDRQCEEESRVWEADGASNFRKALTELAPHHEELFDAIPTWHLFTIWAKVSEEFLGGATCEHSEEGCYFMFDRAFDTSRFNKRPADWKAVRRIMLDIKADQAPGRLAAKLDAKRRAEENANG